MEFGGRTNRVWIFARYRLRVYGSELIRLVFMIIPYQQTCSSDEHIFKIIRMNTVIFLNSGAEVNFVYYALFSSIRTIPRSLESINFVKQPWSTLFVLIRFLFPVTGYVTV